MQGYLATSLSQLTKSLSAERDISTVKALLIEIDNAGKSWLEHIVEESHETTLLGKIVEESYETTLAQLVEPLEILAETDIILDTAQQGMLSPGDLAAIDTMTSLTAGGLVDFIRKSRPHFNMAIPGINLPFPDNLKILATLALAKITDKVAPATLKDSLLELINTESMIPSSFKSIITALIKAEKLDGDSWAAEMQKKLMDSALGGELNRVQYLRALGIEASDGLIKIMDKKNQFGNTALMSVCNNIGHITAVRALLEAGASPDIQNQNGDTALMVACNKYGFLYTGYYGRSVIVDYNKGNTTEMVLTLLAAGANPDMQNKNGYTALMYACEGGEYKHRTMFEALLAKGANPNLQNNAGHTVLMMECARGNFERVGALLAKGANPNIKDNEGNTALITASFLGNLETVQALLAAGANPNLQNNTGDTALITASHLGDLDTVRALLAAGANPDLQNKNGKTALMHTAKDNNIHAAKALLAAGANRQLTDKGGKTAVSYAEWIDMHRLLTTDIPSAATRPQGTTVTTFAGAAATATATEKPQCSIM